MFRKKKDDLTKLQRRALRKGELFRIIHEGSKLPPLTGEKLIEKAEHYTDQDWRDHVFDDHTLIDNTEYMAYFIIGYARIQVLHEENRMPKDVSLEEAMKYAQERLEPGKYD